MKQLRKSTWTVFKEKVAVTFHMLRGSSSRKGISGVQLAVKKEPGNGLFIPSWKEGENAAAPSALPSTKDV